MQLSDLQCRRNDRSILVGKSVSAGTRIERIQSNALISAPVAGISQERWTCRQSVTRCHTANSDQPGQRTQVPEQTAGIQTGRGAGAHMALLVHMLPIRGQIGLGRQTPRA